jgi:hypothetical protein
MGLHNPWRELPTKSPYILGIDRDSITALSKRSSKRGIDQTINDKSLPEPFVGNPQSATVILLNLNPGDSPADRAAHRNPAFRTALTRNLRHEAQKYPFYYLNPDFAWTSGAKWWAQHLHHLFDNGEVGLDRETVARRLCVIEWFPYHSKRAALPIRAVCPSQEYSFELAKKMLGTKLIIGMRAKTRWAAVDRRFGDLPYLKNPQNCCVTIGNAGALFHEIVEALSHR